MTALVCMLVVSIVNMLVGVHLAVVLMGMLMLIVCMATHLGSPPSYLS